MAGGSLWQKLVALAQKPVVWLVLAAVEAAVLWGAWPAVWQRAILPQAGERPGLAVEPVGDTQLPPFETPEARFFMDRPGSLQARAVWKVPRTGDWRIRLTCDDYGSVAIDRKPVIVFPSSYSDRMQVVRIWLKEGLHLVTLNMTNAQGRGRFILEAAPPGGRMSVLGAPELVTPGRAGAWLGLVGVMEGLALVFLAGSMVALAILIFAPGRMAEEWERAGWSATCACLAWVAALALVLRAALGIDLVPPASGMQMVGVLGLVAAFLALGGAAWVRLGRGAKTEGWTGTEVVMVFALAALALILRSAFLGNMEFKYDERVMSYMALNLVRDHIPYLHGMVSSHGNLNPPIMVYVLALPGLVSSNPLHMGLFMSLLGGATTAMTFVLGRRLWGWRLGLMAAVLLACSPWAIRYGMKVWPQQLLIFASVALALYLPAWAERGGLGRAILVGLLAAVVTQCHFTGLLLLGGMVLMGLVWGLRPPGGAFLVSLLAFGLAWLPYLIHLVTAGGGNAPVVAQVLSGPGLDGLRHLVNLIRLGSGQGLEAAWTLGPLAPTFAAMAGPAPLAASFLFALLIAGGAVIAVILPPKGLPRAGLARGDWLRFYLWSALAGILVLCLLHVEPVVHYAAGFLPWPLFLAALGLTRLGDWLTARWSQVVILVVALALAVSGAAFFWRWQEFIGRTGGAGEYGPAYYRVMGHEDFYITNTRPLPIEGVMDRDIDAPARFLR